MVQHKDLLRPQAYPVVRGALLVLPRSLLRLGYYLDLWGAFEADFYPGPSVGEAGP